MAIFDKKEEKGKKAEKAETTPVKSKTNTGDAYKILVKPVVTEKTFKQSNNRQYAFKVSKNANKVSVRKAIEKVYDVKVERVNMVKMRGKTKRYGKTSGKTSDWKKAIVTLKEGQTIAGAQS
jgi:large subunit ribosomal protein L23